jgi:hypothetical protein
MWFKSTGVCGGDRHHQVPFANWGCPVGPMALWWVGPIPTLPSSAIVSGAGA